MLRRERQRVAEGLEAALHRLFGDHQRVLAEALRVVDGGLAQARQPVEVGGQRLGQRVELLLRLLEAARRLAVGRLGLLLDERDGLRRPHLVELDVEHAPPALGVEAVVGAVAGEEPLHLVGEGHGAAQVLVLEHVGLAHLELRAVRGDVDVWGVALRHLDERLVPAHRVGARAGLRAGGLDLLGLVADGAVRLARRAGQGGRSEQAKGEGSADHTTVHGTSDGRTGRLSQAQVHGAVPSDESAQSVAMARETHHRNSCRVRALARLLPLGSAARLRHLAAQVPLFMVHGVEGVVLAHHFLEAGRVGAGDGVA